MFTMLVSCWAFMFFYGSDHKEETCKKKKSNIAAFTHTHHAVAGEVTYVFIVIFSSDMPIVTAKNNKTLCKHKVASIYLVRNVKKKKKVSEFFPHSYCQSTCW